MKAGSSFGASSSKGRETMAKRVENSPYRVKELEKKNSSSRKEELEEVKQSIEDLKAASAGKKEVGNDDISARLNVLQKMLKIANSP